MKEWYHIEQLKRLKNRIEIRKMEIANWKRELKRFEEPNGYTRQLEQRIKYGEMELNQLEHKYNQGIWW